MGPPAAAAPQRYSATAGPVVLTAVGWLRITTQYYVLYYTTVSTTPMSSSVTGRIGVFIPRNEYTDSEKSCPVSYTHLTLPTKA